ncbi:outer membrane protein [Phreatobacter oligotrophus]|uniref:Outer membrane immunogenic protein n=1 Tax=Phreatobacter oligotrophus TaxID=1122261 RepID=A0A2T4Z174_9HYPH|nr:outer membrane protein [Phreatobacter oligotrophus]PTM53497.1 outer membrane immunogenic protein [Phreatobacter oligotrophus]
MKNLLLATTALVAFAGGAQAADLGAPRSPVAAAVVAPAFNWTGFYVGAQFGYGWGAATQPWTAVVVNPVAFPNFQANARQSGLLGGVHVGYNWQINSLVLGVVADVEASGINGNDGGSGGDVNGVRHRWNASLRGRVGFAVDQALIYATGGFAYMNAQGTQTSRAPNEFIGFNTTGWTAGAGVEYAFTPNLTARVEYRYTDYSAKTVIFPVSGYSERIRPQIHAVRLGVSYLFSTGPSAVVARY